MEIAVNNITKQFGNFRALDNVSLTVANGELVALLGPSGCGKTTLLRVIAGLEQPDSGVVSLDGRQLSGSAVRDRGIGFVFQHYALFKHMTVFDNVAFGLTVRPRKLRPSKAEIRERVNKLLDLVHLAAFADRYPSQLSGGQRQRVALARALAVEPQVLLLDEPFGALDAKVRQELRRWMRRLHDEIHITSVLVTHDQQEAMEVADRVVVMNRGQIEQVGTPEEVYHQPSNSFVYDFLDSYNVFDAWQDSTGEIHVGQPVFSWGQWDEMQELWGEQPDVQLVANGYYTCPNAVSRFRVSQQENFAPVVRRLQVFSRPHEVQISKIPQQLGYVPATVSRVNPTGSLVKLELSKPEGGALHVEVSRAVVQELGLKTGDLVGVKPTEMRVF